MCNPILSLRDGVTFQKARHKSPAPNLVKAKRNLPATEEIKRPLDEGCAGHREWACDPSWSAALPRNISNSVCMESQYGFNASKPTSQIAKPNKRWWPTHWLEAEGHTSRASGHSCPNPRLRRHALTVLGAKAISKHIQCHFLRSKKVLQDKKRQSSIQKHEGLIHAAVMFVATNYSLDHYCCCTSSKLLERLCLEIPTIVCDNCIRNAANRTIETPHIWQLAVTSTLGISRLVASLALG